MRLPPKFWVANKTPLAGGRQPILRSQSDNSAPILRMTLKEDRQRRMGHLGPGSKEDIPASFVAGIDVDRDLPVPPRINLS